MLGRNRPRQPINGVIVAISIADVLNLSAKEVAAHADAIRKRLDELHEELKIDFPVYAVFTKMDLVEGFTQYFADLDETKRQAVWGATFQTLDKKANNVGKVPEEIDLLIQRISERMPERLQEEPDLRSRAILFGFPAQLGAIRKPIADFLNRVFEPTRYQTTAILRGFYFTSGTQEGTPFDAVIGALQKSYGVQSLGSVGFSGTGKSFFLADLLTKVIFGEAGWVSTNIAAVRRSFALRAAAFALIGLATAGILGLWWMSYTRNAALITATDQGVTDYASIAGPFIKQNSVTDPNLLPIYELIGSLPNLPVGYAKRNDSTPVEQTFGLSQRPRLQDASNDLYRQALERLLRPRLILSLEQQIQKNIDDPSFVYEALKVYLMLGGKAPQVDNDLILDWFTRDWEDRTFPGAPNAQGRALLRQHLEAMLDMDDGQARKVSLNGPLVEQAQATLARMRVAERAYTLLKSEAHNAEVEDWLATQRGGPDMNLVFEAANGANLDTVRVPGFFTYDGFYAGLLAHLQTIRDKLQKDNWVLGASGDQNAVQQQFASLYPGILELYGRDFIAAWTAAINNLQLKPLLNDKPKYLKLSAASAPTSPIRLIFESIRDETALTRERPKPPAEKDSSLDKAKDKAQEEALTKAGSRLGSVGREALDLAMKSQRKAGDPPPETPGASIEAYFKPIAIMVDGQPGSRPIDQLLANLNELYRQLVLAAENPAQAKQALEQVDVQVASLRANATRLPQPLAGMIDKIAKDAAGDANASSIAQIADAMAQNVTGICQQITANRYPFAKSDRDTPLGDFAKLFAPNGIIDKFYSANLDPLVNRSGKRWVWRTNPNLARKLSDTTLRQFQQAADIRDAFFPTGGATPNVELRSEAPDAEQRRPDRDAHDQRRERRRAARRRKCACNCAMARRWRGRSLDRDGARYARPPVQTRAHRGMGVVPPDRRRLLDRERECAQGQLRRFRARGLLSVHVVVPRQSLEHAGAQAVQVPERALTNMSAGLFGKLPAKRDFIGMNASRRFLEAWEPWLQAGVAMSKQMLGDAWIETYNRAPIWRYWLGADICGEAMIGAFMPSVDGVGRSFPLAIFVGEGDASLAPPELEPNDAWFEAAEAVLLDALEPGATLERIAEKVAALPTPALEPRINKDGGFEELAEGGVLARDVGREVSAAFLAARRFGRRRAFASQTFWWTIGGEGFPSLGLLEVGLPPATRFADMLTGAFSDGAAVALDDAT